MTVRCGLTLIELILALTMLSAAILAVSMLPGTGAIRTQNASAAARELVAALRAARAVAISQASLVQLRFIENPRRANGGEHETIGFALERITSDGNVLLLAPAAHFPNAITGRSRNRTIVFSPSGSVDASLRHTFEVGGRSHIVTVDMTGRVSYVQ